MLCESQDLFIRLKMICLVLSRRNTTVILCQTLKLISNVLSTELREISVLLLFMKQVVK
jgi:hypothetical protein